MTLPDQPERRWRIIRRIRSRAARTPLRVKLLASVLALVVVALGVISLAGVQVLKSYLINQADGQLNTLFNPAQPLPDFRRDLYQGSGPEPFIYEIANPPTKVLWHNGYLPNSQNVPTLRAGAPWLTTEWGHPTTVPSQAGGGHWRVVAYPPGTWRLNTPDGPVLLNATLIVGVDVSHVYDTIGWLLRIDLIVSLLVIFGIGVAGIALVRASLRPLSEIEETAEAIAAGDLSRRVPEADPRTEVGSLGHSLNAMLAQIEAAFAARTRSEAMARRSEERMRQFVADASHELRTPLTTIRGFAEYYRQRGGVDGTDEPVSAADLMEDLATAATSARSRGKLSRAELDRLIKRVEQEAARMGVLVEDLLLLARLDQQRPLEFRTVDLLAIAADSVHDARVIAPQRAITLTVETSRVPLVPGDEVRLRQVVGNLINNALTHTPAGTPIEVTISSGTLSAPPNGGFPANGATPASGTAPANGTAGGPPAAQPAAAPGGAPPVPAVVFKVIDHGPGLTQEQAEHVFERFYRTDRARTRTAGGTGLGLAIVAALIAAHHGRVWVESVPGTGTTFGFALPLSAEALAASHDDADEPDHEGQDDPAPASAATGDQRP